MKLLKFVTLIVLFIVFFAVYKPDCIIHLNNSNKNYLKSLKQIIFILISFHNNNVVTKYNQRKHLFYTILSYTEKHNKSHNVRYKHYISCWVFKCKYKYAKNPINLINFLLPSNVNFMAFSYIQFKYKFQKNYKYFSLNVLIYFATLHVNKTRFISNKNNSDMVVKLCTNIYKRDFCNVCVNIFY